MTFGEFLRWFLGAAVLIYVVQIITGVVARTWFKHKRRFFQDLDNMAKEREEQNGQEH